MGTQMKQRRGTAAEWASANPILGDGEFGYARDTEELRAGNGVDHWLDLPNFQGPPGTNGTNGAAGATGPTGPAASLTTSSGALASNVNTGISNGYVVAFSTASLAVGTWLLEIKALMSPGSTAVAELSLGVIAGTASVTFSSPNASGLKTIINDNNAKPVSISCIATVTVAGTISVVGIATGAVAGIVVAKNGHNDSSTGYTAVKIA